MAHGSLKLSGALIWTLISRPLFKDNAKFLETAMSGHSNGLGYSATAGRGSKYHSGRRLDPKVRTSPLPKCCLIGFWNQGFLVLQMFGALREPSMVLSGQAGISASYTCAITFCSCCCFQRPSLYSEMHTPLDISQTELAYTDEKTKSLVARTSRTFCCIPNAPHKKGGPVLRKVEGAEGPRPWT